MKQMVILSICVAVVLGEGCSPEGPLRSGFVEVTVRGLMNMRDTSFVRVFGSDSMQVNVQSNVMSVTADPSLMFSLSLNEQTVAESQEDTLDSDGDNIPNLVDECPDDKGLPASIINQNGCPPEAFKDYYAKSQEDTLDRYVSVWVNGQLPPLP